MVWQGFVQSWLRNRVQQSAMDVALRSANGNAEAAPLAQVDIVLIAALGMELGGLLDRLPTPVSTQAVGFRSHHISWRERGLLLVESGVGSADARRATEAILQSHRPSWVISTGFAGGLAPEVNRLDVVVGNSVANLAGQRMAIDIKMGPGRGLHVGRLLTADRIIRTAEEKQTLGKEYDALAVDMETFAVADVCRKEKARFLAVRVISDSAADTLPKDVERLINRPSMAGKLGAAAGAIVRRPGSVKDLWNLKEQALLATDRLAAFLLEMLEQLPVQGRTAELPPVNPH